MTTRNADSQASHRQKPPLRGTGVLFALASILLVVTVADYVVSRLATSPTIHGLFVTVLAPVCAGILVALYVRHRGGIHMFLGAIISLPILTAYIFSGIWQFALIAAAFSTIGATVTEVLVRRRWTT